MLEAPCLLLVALVLEPKDHVLVPEAPVQAPEALCPGC